MIIVFYVALHPVAAAAFVNVGPQTRRRAEGVGDLSREAETAAKRPYGLRLRKLMLKPDLQNTEHGLDPEVLRNAGSKVVAVCGAATSSVIVALAAAAIFSARRAPP